MTGSSSMTGSRWRSWIVAPVVGLALGACSATPTPATEPASASVVQGQLSRELLPDLPAVLDNVAREKGSVVVAAVSSSREVPGAPSGGAEPATASTLTIEKTVSGVPLRGPVVLHQLFAPGVEHVELPKLKDGHTYLMAIRPFTYGDPRVLTGEYILVGLEAAWERTGADTYAWMGKPTSPVKLPATVTEAQLR